MKYRKIPGTPLEVSEVGFGVWTLALERSFETKKAHHLLHYALERGINFFETSDSYEQGRGETLIGDALFRERERTVIATRFKVYYPAEFSPKVVQTACEQSLRRLRTDRIDVYQVDYSAISTLASEDLYKTLSRLQQQGKIVTWGCALDSGLGWMEEGSLLMRFRKTRCFQIKFQSLTSELGKDLFQDIDDNKTAVFAATSLFSGSMTLEAPDQKTWQDRFFHMGRPREWFEEKLPLDDELDFVPRQENRTKNQTLLKFILSYPGMVAALVNFCREEDINEAAIVSHSPALTPRETRMIRTLYARRDKIES